MAASWLCATEGRGEQGLDRGIGEARGTDAHPHKVIRSSSGMRSPRASPATRSWKKWHGEPNSCLGRWSTSTASSYCGSRQGPNAFTRSRNTAYVIGNQGLFPKYPSPIAGFLQLDSSLARALCPLVTPCPGATTMLRTQLFGDRHLLAL